MVKPLLNKLKCVFHLFDKKYKTFTESGRLFKIIYHVLRVEHEDFQFLPFFENSSFFSIFQGGGYLGCNFG